MPHDEHHITAMFTRLRTRLMGVARGVVGNDDDVADVLQDAFVKLWLHKSQYASDEHAARAAVVAVRNTSIDQVRRRKAHPVVGLDEAPDVTDEDTAAVRRQVYAEVSAIMRHDLTPLQHQVVEMRELQGMSYDEIAARLGMQPTAVRMQLSRARKRVREIYRNKHKHEDEGH